MKSTLRSSIAALTLLLSACSMRPGPEADLVITDISVIPMTREVILEHRDVVIRGDRIVAITPASTTPPNATEVVDGRGKFLIPGLIDAHVHLTKENPEANVREAEALLGYGVTTALVLHGREGHLQLRDEIARGTRLGPTLLVSARNVNDAELTAAAGDALAHASKVAGYDFIKVYDSISPEGFTGIAASARSIGMPVVGHVPKKVGHRDVQLRRTLHRDPEWSAVSPAKRHRDTRAGKPRRSSDTQREPAARPGRRA